MSQINWSGRTTRDCLSEDTGMRTLLEVDSRSAGRLVESSLAVASESYQLVVNYFGYLPWNGPIQFHSQSFLLLNLS